jgi:hypothetical protein
MSLTTLARSTATKANGEDPQNTSDARAGATGMRTMSQPAITVATESHGSEGAAFDAGTVLQKVVRVLIHRTRRVRAQYWKNAVVIGLSLKHLTGHTRQAWRHPGGSQAS